MMYLNFSQNSWTLIPVIYLGQDPYAHLKKVNGDFYSFKNNFLFILAFNNLLTNSCIV